MNGIAALIIFAVVAMAVFGIFYVIIHKGMGFVGFGRVGAFLALSLGTLLDQFNALPWGTILNEGQAKLVGFSIALSMAVLHVVDQVKAELNNPVK